MKYGSTSRLFKRLLAISVISVLVSAGAALAVGPPPLGQIPVPEPANLGQFVKSKAAAIQLGKALFWDMQVGSDGVQACATCHYRAGADPASAPGTNPAFDRFTSHKRIRNRLHPGPDTLFGNNSTVIRTFNNPVTIQPVDLRASGYPQFGPIYTLQAGDFPFFRVIPANARLVVDPLTGLTTDAVSSLSDTNDVVGSQGIRLADFLAINAGSELETGGAAADPIFNDGIGGNLRRVTPRKAPSVINAVFNYTNFWDGRANNIFNGENPYGPLDQNAGVYIDNGVAANLVKQPVAIRNASLASQAVGQALGDEMSYRGRTFPELGRKLLALTTPPLGKQLVHPNDSVLGTLSRATLQGDGTVAGNAGLSTSYTQMIQNAFADSLWNSSKTVNLQTVAVPAGEPFSQAEANFSLFFGLAIQLYEATLVSERTPFDRFQAGNLNALTATAQNGFSEFISKCATCHSGSELTTAATGSAVIASNPAAFTNNTTHNLIKANVDPNTLAIRLADAGFHNTGVRSTSDDIGRGGIAPSGFPLSFTRLAQTQGLPFTTPKLPQFAFTQPDSVNGSFKVPGLRNVELTAPYFHNGGANTLVQVVEFYTRGGNFPSNPELSGAIQPIGNLRGDPSRQAELVEFLRSLTDDRVRNETAPFDHPELIIPEGEQDAQTTLPPTGGAAPVIPVQTLTLAPVTSPTIQNFQLMTGTVDKDATVAISVNGLPPVAATVNLVALPADLTATWTVTISGLILGINNITITATSPSGGTSTINSVIDLRPAATISGTPPFITTQTFATLTIGGAGVVSYQYSLDNAPFSADIPVATLIVLNGLTDATHTLAVLGKDILGNQQPLASATTATWTVKANPPALTINPVTDPTIFSSQTISGTTDLGVVPQVSADTGALAGTVTASGGTWNCRITGLRKGVNIITVTAIDNAFNVTTKTATITLITPDGNFKGSGITDISDALKALRIAAGIVVPSADDMLHGDVSPLVEGAPAPDSKIDVSDALVILRKVVGLISF